jgi:hypothetical protein
MQIVFTGLSPRNKLAQQREICKRQWDKPKLSFNLTVRRSLSKLNVYTRGSQF